MIRGRWANVGSTGSSSWQQSSARGRPAKFWPGLAKTQHNGLATRGQNTTGWPQEAKTQHKRQVLWVGHPPTRAGHPPEQEPSHKSSKVSPTVKLNETVSSQKSKSCIDEKSIFRREPIVQNNSFQYIKSDLVFATRKEGLCQSCELSTVQQP